ncbi:MAG: phosphoribosylformylglycinamidine synthase subunit PurS [Actinomycetota bacterium]|nr:phosphoribosylformylglycinamidine synthase subunit PurS [Actinomycetota bacterium]
MLKEGIADPQGQTIERALPALGFKGVSSVRVGKHIEVQVDAVDKDAATAALDEMCRIFLANPIIESYRVDVQ